ncbi:hypothetical protein [Salinigranum halophilum]|uniref:hypothetical protein n=1 Tax=Salinigranum halophilum TaxID=2565931 RepID=UPI0010A7B871|nr:hypothetical protein [Salinigranum halophilum]
MARDPFDDHLARLSRRERTAFVGALLSARGWTVEVDPPVIRATRGDERQVVAVASEGLSPRLGRGLPREPVDAVVSIDAKRATQLARDRNVSVWDASAIYDMARYGLDQSSTDRLFGEYFGVTSEAIDRPAAPGDAGFRTRPGVLAAADDRRDGPTNRSTAALAESSTDHTPRWILVVLLILGVTLVGGALAAQAWTDTARTDAALGVDTADDTASLTTAATDTAESTAASQAILPGLTAAGINDTAVLTRGHAAVLEDRSFTMYVRYTERVDGETVGTAQEVVAVENGTVYRSRGTRSGDLDSDLVPVIVRDLYADGESRYLRQDEEPLRVGDADDPGTGRVVDRSQALVIWYLSGERSTRVDQVQHRDETAYRVTVEGTTDRRFEDYRATGLISERGLVVRVDATYRLPDSDRVATVSIRHSNVGETTVDRPDWLSAQNETTDHSSALDTHR